MLFSNHKDADRIYYRLVVLALFLFAGSWMVGCDRQSAEFVAYGNYQRTGAVDISPFEEFSSIAWQYSFDGELRGTVAFHKGLVFVQSEEGHLIAIDETTGKNKWRFQADDTIVNSPVFVNDLAVVGSKDAHIYGVSLATGQRAWRYKTGDDVNGSPVVAGGEVIVPSCDGKLYAIDPASGAEKWNLTIDSQGKTCITPAYSDGTLYVISYNWDGESPGAHLHAVTLEDRTILWSAKLGDEIGDVSMSMVPPVFADGLVLVLTVMGNLHAYEAATGQLKWSFQVDSTEERHLHSNELAYDNGRVYVVGPDKLYAVDHKTGESKWKYSADGELHSGLLITQGWGYVGAKDGNLHAVDLTNGQHKWSYKVEGAISRAPILVGGTLIFRDDERVYAIK